MMELKGFYFPGSVIEIHHYYHTSFSSEVIRAKVELPKESSLGESVELLGESSLGNRVELLRESSLGDRVELPGESSLGDRVELPGESSLGDRVELPGDFPFIPYLQRYGTGQLSPIREESPLLVNTSTKPFYV
jgi:hypothetical protein